YPQLSNPDAPDYDDWAGEPRGHLAALADGGELVAISHSMSFLLWLKSTLTDNAVIDLLMLLSPPHSAKLPPGAADFRLHLPPGLDREASKDSCRTPIQFGCSDSGGYIPAGSGALYGDEIGAEVAVLPGAGHISMDEGYGPWAAVDEWCSDPS